MEKELSQFVKGADLILYDAQYFENEYEKYKGYGHSTPEVTGTVLLTGLSSQ
ncbi:MAG: hypothetical protein K6F75_12925 [Butyrivibrio sp.]|nr:hypothetical protein [Butyrivibrio sp.]